MACFHWFGRWSQKAGVREQESKTRKEEKPVEGGRQLGALWTSEFQGYWNFSEEPHRNYCRIILSKEGRLEIVH